MSWEFRVRHPQAQVSACHPLPCPPGMPTFPLSLAASAAPDQDCIILGFVCRAAGGGGGPAAHQSPSLSSLSTPSWVILLLPPFWGPWHPRNCLLYPKALSSLSTFSRSPGSPRGSRGKGKEAEGQGPAPGWKLPSSFLLSTRWKTGAATQRNTWL